MIALTNLSMLSLTDSHAHLTSSNLKDDLDAVISRARQAGVNKIVNICTDADSLLSGLDLAKKYSGIFNAAALHPHDTNEMESFWDQVEKHAKQKDLVAIGETGLDYYYQHSSVDSQQTSLRKHLKLAIQVGLPVIIHCREAFEDFFRISGEEYSQGGIKNPGVLHCFTGTLDEAKKALDRGWYISFSGIVTFKKSEDLRKVVSEIPLEKILIETDAPYLAPQSQRGKPNEPAFIIETAEVIATIKGVSLQKICQITQENCSQLFNI